MLSNGTAQGWAFTYISFKSGSAYPTPVFLKKGRDGAEDETFTTIGGALESIEQKEGNFWPEFSLIIVDGSEKYKVQFGFNNNLATSLLNSLAWAESLNCITISTYAKEGYGRISVKAWEDELTLKQASRAWTLDELKELTTTVTVNGKPVKDKTNLFAFMKETMIPTIQSKLEGTF